MDYLKNIELALALGFKKVIDVNAYNGCYFIKNNLIWIHDIEALKFKLGIVLDQDLEDKYDVKSYYKYIDMKNEMVDFEIDRIKLSIFDSKSALFGQNELLDDDEVLYNMARLAVEGFDEDILRDYAHQMSKK